MAHQVLRSLKLPLMVGASALTVAMGTAGASAESLSGSDFTISGPGFDTWVAERSVDVQNADFEALTLNDGEFARDIPGWSIYNGEAGTFNPIQGHHLVGGSGISGDNAALAGGSAAGFTSIQQNLSEVIAAGSRYRMNLSMGLRMDGPYAVEQFVVGLYATDGVTSYELGKFEGDAYKLIGGSFLDERVDTGLLDDTYAGMNLRIELTAFGFNPNLQVLFDDIRVDAGRERQQLFAVEQAPTPTAAVAGLALMGGMVVRRRRHRVA